VFSREFQYTCLAFWSPAIKTGNPPPRQATRSAPISSRVLVWDTGWGVRSKDQTGIPIGIVTRELSPPRGQPRVPVYMFAFWSPAIKTGNPLPKQATRSAPISGRVRERYGARTSTGLLASTICMAVTSSWVRPGKRTEW